MAIQLNDNIRSNVNRPLDFKYGPFISTAEALLTVPLSQRYHGLTFGVYDTPGDLANSDITVYYFYNDLTVFKPFGGTTFEWVETSANLTMEQGKGYISTNDVTRVDLTLPVTSERDIIRIAGKGSAGFRILIPGGITLMFTDVNVPTSLSSVEPNASIDLVSVSENMYIVNASIGNFEYPEP